MNLERNIILASYLFGSSYIFKTSLDIYNKNCLNKTSNKIYFLNTFMLIFTGGLFMFNSYLGLSVLGTFMKEKLHIKYY